MKQNIIGLTPENLDQFFLKIGEKKFRTKQVLDWIYKKNIFDFSQMSNLNKNLRQILDNNFLIELPEITDQKISAIDGTTKFLLKLKDNNTIETVLMNEKDRNTICISTQVGCPLACKFCLTGQIGFIRNLEVPEIISQILLTKQFIEDKNKRLNIVVMGMGEPLLNYDNLVKAIKFITLDWGIGLGKKRVTISTAGIADKIYKLADQNLGTKLAISLNSANNEKRDYLMPINKKFPLEILKKSLLYYQKKDNRNRITFEYILIKNINDSPEDAHQILNFVKGLKYKINLIPYNESDFLDFKSPNENDIQKFIKIILNGNGAVTVRRSKGSDILAACGQLKANFELKCQIL